MWICFHFLTFHLQEHLIHKTSVSTQVVVVLLWGSDSNPMASYKTVPKLSRPIILCACVCMHVSLCLSLYVLFGIEKFPWHLKKTVPRLSNYSTSGPLLNNNPVCVSVCMYDCVVWYWEVSLSLFGIGISGSEAGWSCPSFPWGINTWSCALLVKRLQLSCDKHIPIL